MRDIILHCPRVTPKGNIWNNEGDAWSKKAHRMTIIATMGPILAIYQARFMKYMEHREIKDTAGRNVWAYDSIGNRTEKIYYEWNSGIYYWEFKNREVWTFDTNGNRTEEINYDWDVSATSWLIREYLGGGAPRSVTFNNSYYIR